MYESRAQRSTFWVRGDGAAVFVKPCVLESLHCGRCDAGRFRQNCDGAPVLEMAHGRVCPDAVAKLQPVVRLRDRRPFQAFVLIRRQFVERVSNAQPARITGAAQPK